LSGNWNVGTMQSRSAVLLTAVMIVLFTRQRT